MVPMMSIPATASARGATRPRTRPPVARARSERTRRGRSGDAGLSAGDWSRGDTAERAPAPAVGTAARFNGRTARRARLAGSAGVAAPTALRVARFTALCAWPGLLLALARAIRAARLVADFEAMARLAAFLARPLAARLGAATRPFPAALAEPL